MNIVCGSLNYHRVSTSEIEAVLGCQSRVGPLVRQGPYVRRRQYGFLISAPHLRSMCGPAGRRFTSRRRGQLQSGAKVSQLFPMRTRRFFVGATTGGTILGRTGPTAIMSRDSPRDRSVLFFGPDDQHQRYAYH